MEKQKKKQILLNNLSEFLDTTKDQQLQLKPQDGQILQSNDQYINRVQQKDLEEYKKDYSTRIDKQLLIISQNVSNSLFNLPNQKFSAFMSRYNVWGFDLTMQQFIINYYLVVKTDNKLRQFVMLHMDKIIKIAKDFIEKYLITHMFDFDFTEPRIEYVRKQLIAKKKENDIKLKEKTKDKDFKPVEDKKDKEEQAEVPEQHATTEEGIPEIQPFNPQIKYPQSIPSILTLDDVMKMTEEQKENINQTAQNGNIPEIKNNMENVVPTKEKKKKTKKTKKTQVKQEQTPVEPQSDEEAKMKQQILDNLKKEHQNLQKGITTNG